MVRLIIEVRKIDKGTFEISVTVAVFTISKASTSVAVKVVGTVLTLTRVRVRKLANAMTSVAVAVDMTVEVCFSRMRAVILSVKRAGIPAEDNKAALLTNALEFVVFEAR